MPPSLEGGEVWRRLHHRLIVVPASQPALGLSLWTHGGVHAERQPQTTVIGCFVIPGCLLQNTTDICSQVVSSVPSLPLHNDLRTEPTHCQETADGSHLSLSVAATIPDPCAIQRVFRAVNMGYFHQRSHSAVSWL